MSPAFRKSVALVKAISPLSICLMLPTSVALAQDSSDLPYPPATAPSTQSTAPASTPTAPTTKTTPANPPTPKTATPKSAHVKASQEKPTSTPSASFLDQRIDLSDTHHIWHPSRKQLGLEKQDGSYRVSSGQLTHYLEGIAPYVRRAPARARVALAGGAVENPVATTSSSASVPAKVMPASDGIKLDVAASVAKVSHALNANPKLTKIILSVHTSPAPSGSADYSGIDARLAHFVTHFNPGERGRTQTVRLAIKLIDGHVIAPGAVFSVNQTVGERTAQRGFGEGIVFVNGRQETQLGGGMCQVATTLFNAALLANMKIVQRFQHVRTVPYVKPGQDATVYWGQKDFKFENDTQTPIYISYKTTATHAICDIFGKADPTVKVSIRDTYKHLGPRHYTAVLRRYVRKNGVTTNDYTVYSGYKWTPSLDYNL